MYHINNPLNCDASFLVVLYLEYLWRQRKMLDISGINHDFKSRFWTLQSYMKYVFLTVFKRYNASVFKREICSLRALTILLINLPLEYYASLLRCLGTEQKLNLPQLQMFLSRVSIRYKQLLNNSKCTSGSNFVFKKNSDDSVPKGFELLFCFSILSLFECRWKQF